MSFLKTLFGGAKAPQKATPAAAKPASKAGSNIATAKSGLNGNAPRAQSPKRSAPVISRRDDIPTHSAVLSSEGALLELPDEWQKHYAILLVSKDKKDVVVVVSTAKGGDGAKLDDDYLAISDRIQRSGYKRTRKYQARPEILAIIYESGSSSSNSEEQQRTASKIQLDFDDLLRQAVSEDISDIHIEVTRDSAKVRFRKNGDLYVHTEWPVSYARIMAQVIYQVIADEKDLTFDEARPQSAIIDRELSENFRLRVRLNTLPGFPSGFDMIMRLLKMGHGKPQPMGKLGYAPALHLSNIRRAVAKPVGALILAGTTGSGKSTSLNSMLYEKIEAYGGRIKVITVEDPPEYQLPGATQVPVLRSRAQAKAGDKSVNPFASVVAAAMRSDPDILMVGEVRDHASAELLTHAVQSGHQVYTTVHASSAVDIVPRLRSNGIEDDVLGGQNFIAALMYQTLLPVLCPKCSTSMDKFKRVASSEADVELLERIHKHIHASRIDGLRFKSEAGCPSCSNGITGRTVAAEVVLPDAFMLKCFRERQEGDAFMHYRRLGGKIALDHGLHKALIGHCDIRDVEYKLDRITYLDELQQSMAALHGETSTSIYIINQTGFEEDAVKPSAKKTAEPVIDSPAEPLKSKLLNPQSGRPSRSADVRPLNSSTNKTNETEE